MSNTTQKHSALAIQLISDILNPGVKWELVRRDNIRLALGLTKHGPDVRIIPLPNIVIPERSASLHDRIRDGAYDSVSGSITEEAFPLTLPAGPRNLVMICFDIMTTSREVKEWAVENRYTVALIDDLVAVGSHPSYKDLQREHPILALGSSITLRDTEHVVGLEGGESQRGLSVGSCEDGWGGGYYFLMTPKKMVGDY